TYGARAARHGSTRSPSWTCRPFYTRYVLGWVRGVSQILLHYPSLMSTILILTILMLTTLILTILMLMIRSFQMYQAYVNLTMKIIVLSLSLLYNLIKSKRLIDVILYI